MKLLKQRIVQDVDTKLSFADFLTLSAKLGAIRSISQRHGVFFMMTEAEMKDRQWHPFDFVKGVDTYVFWCKDKTMFDGDIDTVEF